MGQWDSASPAPAGCPRSGDPPSAVQSPSAFVPALLPAHGARASLTSLPGPATLGDICACCCDTGGNTEPPTLIPWGWTDAAAGFTDTLARMESQETWPGRRWSWGSGKDQTPGLGAFPACLGPPALLCLGICPS